MTRDEALRILTDHADEIREMGVRSLALFGSACRNEAQPESDLDLLVEFAEPVGLFRFLDVKAYLESILDHPVDLVTRGALKPQLREAILGEAVRAL
jgi:predicted nucleotidyltransferase